MAKSPRKGQSLAATAPVEPVAPAPRPAPSANDMMIVGLQLVFAAALFMFFRPASQSAPAADRPTFDRPTFH